MAVESNGRAGEPGQKGMNGHAKAPRSKPVRKSTKSFGLVSFIFRALTWLSIFNILVRCPSTVDLITESSPSICKPYFQIRSVVAPHLEPYYTTYAASYVDAAKPYYDTLDRKVIAPATVLGKKYAAPRVAQLQAFGQAQWDKSVQPQVQKYQTLVKGKYDETLGPHVDTAVAAAGPYYEIAKTGAQQTYYEHLLPTYNAVQPYVLQGIGIANEFAFNTALPYSKWAWTAAVVFLDRTVWPQIRILYGENVEPQLVRIGERLGRYRDGKKLKAVVEDIDSSSSASIASQTLSSIASSISSVHATPIPEPTSTETILQSSEAPEATPASEVDVREKAQKIVTHDLKEWQEKFAKAADEGSVDLEERITEITDRMIQKQAEEVGKAHIIQLEETVNSSLKKLKSAIISIVSDSQDTEESETALRTAVRKAGIAIKEKAQAVRSWRQNYDRETNELISLSASDTFEILDHIRDLGLQEIGMRWAWTDGITHKDWAKYHQLKTKFDEWRVDVEKVVTSHPGLDKARAASEDIENQAMVIAEDSAKELARLKETGRWKIQAADSSDDFSTKIMPAKAAVVMQKVAEKATELSEAVAPSTQTQGTVESVISVGSASASSLADQVSSSIIGTQQGTIESIASAAKVSASSVVDQASSSVIGTQQGSVESIASVAKASASSIVEQASSSIIGTSTGIIESVASVASQSASSLSAKASSSIAGEKPGVVEQASSSIKSAVSIISESASSISAVASSSVSSATIELSEGASKVSSSLSSATSSIASSLSKSSTDTSSSVSSAASSASSTASKKIWGGAMAQHVEERKIIFDDIVDDSEDASYSEKLQSMASQAGDRYADMTNAVSEALLKSTIIENSPVTKLAAEKYSSALSAASIALYGTEQGTGESISSVVASKYDEAVAAASAILYGTPMPVTDSIAAQATNAYNAAVSKANENYSSARSLVSAQISGEPKPMHQEMYSSVEAALSDSKAAASSRLQSALVAASTAIYGFPTPAYQSILSSISSVAQAKLSDGLSRASSQYKEGKDYVAAIQTGAPAKQKLLGQMQEQYYAGIGMAHARYSEFLESASSAVMPAKTPLYQSLYSDARVKIAGLPTDRFVAAVNTASVHYSEAVGAASSKFDQLLASISSLGSENAEHVPTVTLVSAASAQYSAAMSQASESFASINSVISEKLELGSSSVSSAVYGTENPWTESVASVASENWEELITKASEQVYGAPTPYFVTRRLLSEVKEYAAQATDGAISQYAAVQSLIGELVSGKEPDFTESVYGRLSSAYYTGAAEAASSASSVASEAYASATSVLGSVFTPPPSLEAILDSASLRVNEAVEAASVQLYGRQKGTYEEATSAAASAYSSAQSVASEKLYGTTTGYVEAAQSSISDAALSAQKAISEAIYGTETGTYEKATAAMAEAYASAAAHASQAIYGPEKGAIESAQNRLSAAVESARVKLAEFASSAGEGASDAVRQASEGVEDFASSVSSAISSATSHDEL
ncbi:related to Similarity to mucins, glucan 1,4-alpha-glucosidase and exo-alpha-sialidase [Rhynchosporium secalis]|uniref:Related to Similarity to mucins, glucan 1,4-alpha-glucosidase and exo-alpha-sialidase n=1 Tax=Rhynchosporium secalis TaxID=38038 RepID=A0A1E1MHP7_RHYSE|nr:related to Similarity to mucins, glucan 1,4-alpha-glucosidase and exo-alpha-sialidase [Rhynchosporium secalis]